MQLTLRSKLMILVGSVAVAFGLSTSASAVLASREAEILTELQQRIVPKLSLGPRLKADVEATSRRFQDAVAAEDTDMLEGARTLHARALERLEEGRAAFEPGPRDAFRRALDDYYQHALGVSQRLIHGETGEPIVAAMRVMRQKQEHLNERLRSLTEIDRGEVLSAFENANESRQTAARLRLAINGSCLIFLFGLSLWLSRDLMKKVASLSSGLVRFGKGAFETPIAVAGNDELAGVAGEANRMAASLAMLLQKHEDNDWLNAGRAAVAQELRGELDATEVARRAVTLLVGYVGAVAGALYVREPDGRFTLQARAAHGSQEEEGACRIFGPGEGLIGRAAGDTEILHVPEVPDGYAKVASGLGEALPRSLTFVPLSHGGSVRGVLELAFFRPLPRLGEELLASVGETLAIALEVGAARTRVNALLAETQEQAARLTTQEEELRSHNEELSTQQEELRQANEELEIQRSLLKERNDELEEARKTLQAKADELTKVSGYKSRFLTNMSHELRTPLNSMLLLSNLLAEQEAGELTPKQVEYCRTIHSAGQDLLNLINDLLDLAKIEAGKHELHLAAVPLRALADGVLRRCGPLARDKGLEFLVETSPDSPESIVTDQRRIDQVLTNLVGNAIKFTDEGKVTLSFGRPPAGAPFGRSLLGGANCIEIVVTDTGVGIDAADQERVFAAFQQAGSPARSGGTGLGLAIVRELVALLGGEIRLESARGAGSTFRVVLPEVCPDVPRPPQPAAFTRTPAAAPSSALPITDDSAKASHVLLIEDDPVFVEQLTGLIHQRGFEVVVASSGEEGLRLARGGPVGIVLDVRLPDLDGFDVMRRLQADPATRSIPVHFISALDAPDQGIALGAIGYLTKPASRAQLARVVQALVDGAAAKHQGILVVQLGGRVGRESVGDLLRREGFSVRQPTSPDEAFDWMEREAFAAVVVDLETDGVDGIAFTEELRRRAAKSGAQKPAIVVYTSQGMNRSSVQALRLHADAVVLKEGRSTERLLTEIRLFVQHVRDGLGARAPKTSLAIPSPDLRLEGKKLLVVDDDMRTVYALSAMLQAKGAEVVTAENGREALRALDENAGICCVLMDIMMPEMDGYEAIRRIRDLGRFEGLPIIVLTAKAMETERDTCITAGANGYLAKPVDGARLLSLLREQLRLEGPHGELQPN